jgi:hypothetical protein
MKKGMVAAVVLVVAVAGAATAQAGVDFNINVDLPLAPITHRPVAVNYPGDPQAFAVAPRMVVDEAPQFIYAPQLGCYVSVGTPYDMVYSDQSYYLYSNGYWYLSPSYNGPWSIVSYSRLPHGLRRHRYEQIRQFRDYEYSTYLRDRDHYRGTWYRPSAIPVVEHRDGRRDHRWEERRDGRWDDRRDGWRR